MCIRDSPMAVHRAVRKVRKVEEYEAAVERVFRDEPLTPVARFHG